MKFNMRLRLYGLLKQNTL